MSVSVNLASQGVENKKRDVYKQYAGWFFVACVLLSTAVLSYSFFLRLQLSGIEDEEETLLSQMKQYEGVVVDHSYLDQKLSHIVTILNGRSPVPTRFSSFLTEVSDNVEVERVDTSANVMNFRLISPDLAALQNFMSDGLQRFIEGNDVQTVHVTSFGLDTRNSQYYMNVSIEYTP